MEFLVTALFLLAAAGLFRDGDSRRDLSAGLLWFVAGYCGGHGTLQLCNGDHRPRNGRGTSLPAGAAGTLAAMTT